MRILITGASRGIGYAIKETFKKYGDYHIDSPTREELDLSVKSDFLNYSNYDVIVNNAGINPLHNLDSEISEEVMRVNYFSPLKIINNSIQHMISNGYGRILNIGSVWINLSKPKRGNYSASKSALDSLSRSISSEYSKYNVLCNTVSPGFIKTDMTYKNNSKEDIEKLESEIPMLRLGLPQEVAELVYFLTVKNTYITGQNIIIDGGYTCTA